MTIKRRLFISNILMVVLTFASFVLAGRIVISIVMNTSENGVSLAKTLRAEREAEKAAGIPRHPEYGAAALFVFLVLMILIGNALTYHFFRTFIRPLNILGEGVRQIHDKNLAYRIVYEHEDEFRPVCESFNEMAGRLETLAAKQQKDESNRRELIAGISHDLRTPLTSIRAYLEGIETGVASSMEQRKKYFTTIKNKVNDLEHIINQLFIFSKLDIDDFPLDIKTFDLGPLVADMIAELSGEYAKRDLALELGETVQNIQVDLDPVMFRTVIVNILENSVNYRDKDRACLVINCRPAGDKVEIRLSDDGPGVPEEALEKLFDVFFRADPSRNTKGNGLGLAISQKIIDRLGGTMKAEAPSAGRGLSIIICLPIAGGTAS
jgi:signal transduction histidine kinase